MWPFGNSTEKRLQAAVKENQALSPYNLSVKVEKKTAFFSGQVPRENLKNIIKNVAEGINGIKSVDTSGVSVAGGGAAPASEASSDGSALAKAAQAKIKAEASLANNPLDVLQKGTTIVLRGALDSEAEFNKAKDLASSVAGVTGVDTSGLQVIQNASKLNNTDDDGDIVYTVESGDTLSHIALHYYGDAGRTSYMKIADANGLDDPNKIFVGQKLKIPGTTAGPEARLG